MKSQVAQSFVLNMGQKLLSSKIQMAIKTTKQKQIGVKMQKIMDRTKPGGATPQTKHKVAFLYNKKNMGSQSVCESLF